MEEILASIRRIISEDGAPQQDPEMGPSGSEPTPAAAAPDEHSPTTAAPAEAADDALLLTEMVNEDGSVVSLAETSDSARPAPIEPAPEPPLPEPPAAPPSPARAAAPAEPEPPPPSFPEETMQEPELGVLEAEPAPAPEPQPEPEPTMPEPDLPEEPRAEAASSSPDPSQSIERLVSEGTFAASTAALSQLSRNLRKDKDIQVGGGRMVEDLVREALEPMLKAWLDAHLQEIVERLVRQEIERMVRRAQED